MATLHLKPSSTSTPDPCLGPGTRRYEKDHPHKVQKPSFTHQMPAFLLKSMGTKWCWLTWASAPWVFISGEKQHNIAGNICHFRKQQLFTKSFHVGTRKLISESSVKQRLLPFPPDRTPQKAISQRHTWAVISHPASQGCVSIINFITLLIPGAPTASSSSNPRGQPAACQVLCCHPMPCGSL